MNVEVLGDDVMIEKGLEKTVEKGPQKYSFKTPPSVGAKLFKFSKPYTSGVSRASIKYISRKTPPAVVKKALAVSNPKNVMVGYGFGADNWFTQLGRTVLKDTTQAVIQTIGTRITPTQRAAIQQITTSVPSIPSVQQEPQADGLKKNLPYIIAGGAVLLGVVVMIGTRKPRAA